MTTKMKWRLFYVYSYLIGLVVLAALTVATASLPPVSGPIRKIRWQARAHADEAYGVPRA
jgi:hypothetical protein